MSRDYGRGSAGQAPGRAKKESVVEDGRRAVEANQAPRPRRTVRPSRYRGREQQIIDRALRRAGCRAEVRRVWWTLATLADADHGLALATRQVVAENLSRWHRDFQPSLTAITRALRRLEEVGALVRLEAPVEGGRLVYAVCLLAYQPARKLGTGWQPSAWVPWSTEARLILEGRQAEIVEPVVLHWRGGSSSTLRMRLRRRALRCDTYGSAQVSHLTSLRDSVVSRDTSSAAPATPALSVARTSTEAPPIHDDEHEVKGTCTEALVADTSGRRPEPTTSDVVPVVGGRRRADRTTGSETTTSRPRRDPATAWMYRRASLCIAALELGTGERFNRRARRWLAEEVVSSWETTASAVWSCRLAAWRARRRDEVGELEETRMGYALSILRNQVDRHVDDEDLPHLSILNQHEAGLWRDELAEIGAWERYLHEVGAPLTA